MLGDLFGDDGDTDGLNLTAFTVSGAMNDSNGILMCFDYNHLLSFSSPSCMHISCSK